MLRERGIDIFLFVEHPIYRVSNVQSVLILACWFYFVASYRNSTCKTFLFSKLQQKKQRYWQGTLKNDLNLAWFCFVTAYKDSIRKAFLLWKFWECRQGSINIASFLKQLVHNLFKVTNIINIVWLIFICPEAVARRCSIKKLFIEILQNSQENTRARVSFLIKLQS